MSPPLRLRLLEAEDLPFADSLRALAGWNQTLEDWRRFLATEPDGCFLAEWDGTPAGTATTTVYGPELAWIGMVLVHPEYRRRGIGRALLGHCIDHLRQRGVRSIKLDATPEGQLVYQGFGFRATWTLKRWHRHPAPPTPAWERQIESFLIWHWRAVDAARADELDLNAFGTSRRGLIERLCIQSRARVVASCSGMLGWGMVRPGAHGWYLGPVVAQASDCGLGLVGRLLDYAAAKPVYWDIPDPNTAAGTWARSNGFRVERSLTRMVLGEDLPREDPRRQFAIGGPEVG